MSNVRKYTKKTVNFVVTTVVSFTAANAIANSTYPKTKIQKIEVLAGSWTIGMMVSELTGEWIDKKVDAAFDWYNTTFEKTL